MRIDDRVQPGVVVLPTGYDNPYELAHGVRFTGCGIALDRTCPLD